MTDDIPEPDPELDTRLDQLFAPVRPDAALEDRMIHRLRTIETQRRLRSGWKRRFAIGIAASVGLGLTGMGVSTFAASGRLAFPGEIAMRFPGDSVMSRGSKVATSPSAVEVENVVVTDGTVNQLGTDSKLPEQWNGVAPTESGGGTAWYYNRSDLPALDIIKPAEPASKMNSTDRPLSREYYFAPNDMKPAFAPSRAPVKEALEKSVKDRIESESVVEEKRKELPPVELGLAVNGGSLPKPGTPVVAANPIPAKQIVIRNGAIDFEIDSFDASVATILQLLAKVPNAYSSTINSEKLPNGKVRGVVVVRVPPDKLDAFVLDLRKELGKVGELKGQRIGSQDITKQYTDLESRLKAAKTMEERLLQIIKEGKGEIKTLLEAEKELGVWRTRIEEMEGEIRYYSNLVSLSTLTINLVEKEIRAAAEITERERVQVGVETEDVDTALREAVAMVTEVKGRVSKSELKQLAAGQFTATLHFEVAPESSGPIRDRLKQLGRVSRLEIDRVQDAEGGTPQKDMKVKRGDSQFLVQFYNIAGIQPRETAMLHVAMPNVETGYQKLREAVTQAKGRVLAANLNEQDRQNITAQLDFEVRRADDAGIQAAIAALGDAVSRTVTRAPESETVTDAKIRYQFRLFSVEQLSPRQTTTLSVEVPDVDGMMAVVGAKIGEAGGKVINSQITRDPSGKVTALLTYDVPLASATGLVEQFQAAGTVRVHETTRNPQAPEGRFAKARLTLTLTSADPLLRSDDSIVEQVRRGLSYSLRALLMSLTWVVFGLCVFVPWLIVGFGGYRLIRRVFRPRSPAA